MRTLIFAATLALAACGQPEADVAPTPVESDAPPAAADIPSVGVDGWEIDQTAYAKINTQLPVLSAKKPDGSEFTAASLRGRWTILGLWPAQPPAEESTYTAALNSAADQDPDLDVLVIHPAGAMPQPVPPWPALEDTGALTTLAPPSTPAYLLIGPDLTIEGYRGALSATPDDGIKPVIRGVAEIRKQIAAPH